VGLGSGARKFMLTRPPLRHLEVYTTEFEPAGSTGDEQYTHGDAQELVLVMRGRARLFLGDEVHDLAEGDSVEYATSIAHRLVNTGAGPAEVLWIISPPTPDAVPAGSDEGAHGRPGSAETALPAQSPTVASTT
jgi:uncharacterized cupin superfamily protein